MAGLARLGFMILTTFLPPEQAVELDQAPLEALAHGIAAERLVEEAAQPLLHSILHLVVAQPAVLVSEWAATTDLAERGARLAATVIPVTQRCLHMPGEVVVAAAEVQRFRMPEMAAQAGHVAAEAAAAPGGATPWVTAAAAQVVLANCACLSTDNGGSP